MSAPAPFTSLPPQDQRRFSYTYYGQRVLPSDQADRLQPLYLHERLLQPTMWIFGEEENAQRQLLLSLAVHDLAVGNSVVFIDGKYDPPMRDQLYGWTTQKLGRPLYSLVPLGSQAQQTHSWNPFICKKLPPGVLFEIFIHTFLYSQSSKNRANLDFGRKLLHMLFEALQHARCRFSPQDLVHLLRSGEVFGRLKEFFPEQSQKIVSEYLRMQGEPHFKQKSAELLEFLSCLNHASLNSYAPSILLDDICKHNSLLYVGLPQTQQPSSIAIGNLLVNQLKALISSHAHGEAKGKRKLTLFLHQTGNVLDEDILQWLIQHSLESVRIITSASRLQSFSSLSDKLAEDLLAVQGIVSLFPTQDRLTAQWFIKLWNLRNQRNSREYIELKLDEVLALRNGQQLTQIHSHPIPLLIASAALPILPSQPHYQYQHHYPHPLKTDHFKGLFAHRYLSSEVLSPT